MKIENNPTITLSREAIELAIKEYIDRNIPEKLYIEGTKVSFNLEDITKGEGCRKQYKITSKVSLKYLT